MIDIKIIDYYKYRKVKKVNWNLRILTKRLLAGKVEITTKAGIFGAVGEFKKSHYLKKYGFKFVVKKNHDQENKT